MDQYVTGAVIKELREKAHLTQAELATKLSVSANMLRSKFYVCPICGNTIHSMGEAVINCHGILLTPCQAEETDEKQMIKLYREGNAEARIKINGVKKIFFYCNRDGLFSINVIKEIDDKQSSYDEVEERQVLEQVAKKLFG